MGKDTTKIIELLKEILVAIKKQDSRLLGNRGPIKTKSANKVKHI